jgi:rhamnosyltransferase
MASEAGTAQTMNPGSKADVCAVVVTYHPDPGFPDRLDRVRPQVGRVVVVDNGSSPQAREMLRNAAGPDVGLIFNDANLGVATALNQGVRHVMGSSCRWVLTLDQDSTVEPFLVEALLEAYNDFPKKENLAVVGSNYYDEKRTKTLVPESPAQPSCLEQTTVITSGSMISVDAYAEVGPFRDDFFIDHVDDEYCLRARAMGYKVILCRRPVIRHSIGGAVGKRFLGRMVWSSNHSATRRYYMGRNFSVLFREYLGMEPRWILRTLARHLGFLAMMVLLEDRRCEKLRRFLIGIPDGICGRTGPISFDTIPDRWHDR